ncbi:ribonuclease P protein component [Candidatus Saccharibacteria bacterium RIFCSPHIGHO2_01_FULL_45_15]|nr:MAG: ribonuclease P protein component [Candidatus Saccharibacteria bacterium RIFCSPHIGHO2_01_FULL_45_15]OGL27159.1 MAG: ribonuclease P protein component [Candidatus Saccharibacteria bacterium RIFCSPHIGHO2_02_FULL_46_12]OGL32802.1 MAG: ribonuclease P protein component [Candidatus Saccharibacteria bacterium RIFCSPHIGHO2_12_FULL_44_22]
MLAFKYRFHGHNSLRFVYKNGQAERTRLITLKSITNPHRKESRVAVVISKKVLKSAVGRNRVRRRLYELIRVRLERFDQPTDLVFLVFSAEVRTMSAEDLELLVDQLLSSVEHYKNAA